MNIYIAIVNLQMHTVGSLYECEHNMSCGVHRETASYILHCRYVPNMLHPQLPFNKQHFASRTPTK